MQLPYDHDHGGPYIYHKNDHDMYVCWREIYEVKVYNKSGPIKNL
jgi:hypothetical protein